MAAFCFSGAQQAGANLDLSDINLCLSYYATLDLWLICLRNGLVSVDLRCCMFVILQKHTNAKPHNTLEERSVKKIITRRAVSDFLRYLLTQNQILDAVSHLHPRKSRYSLWLVPIAVQLECLTVLWRWKMADNKTHPRRVRLKCSRCISEFESRIIRTILSNL